MTLFTEIKTLVAKYEKSLSLISGIITAIGGLSSLLYGVHIWQLSLVLITLGAYLITRSILIKITTSNVTRFGQVHWNFPEPKRKRSEKLLVLNNILFTAIVITSGGIYFYDTFLHKHPNHKKFGIVISNFIDKGTDRFSLDLGNYFNDSLYIYDKQDTIGAETIDSHLRSYNKNKLELLRDTFLKTGFERGILVFGHRIDQNNEFSKNFQCRIFLCNTGNTTMNAFVHDRPVIKVPDIFDFRVSDEVHKVYYFILGLLFNKLGDMVQADAKILSALNLDTLSNNGNMHDKTFSGYCYLLLGQTKVMQSNYKEAVDWYTKGISADSTNALLHYNLAVSLWNLNNKEEAYAKFLRAHELNKDLKIPIEHFTEAPAAPDAPSANPTNNGQKTLAIIQVANTPTRINLVTTASGTYTNPAVNLVSNTAATTTVNTTPTKTTATTNQKEPDGEWIDESEIEYHVVIYSAKVNLGYITTDGRYIKFKSGDDEAFYVIGKYKREGYNSFAIYDMYNNPVYSVIDKTIYFFKTSNAVGELRVMKK